MDAAEMRRTREEMVYADALEYIAVGESRSLAQEELLAEYSEFEAAEIFAIMGDAEADAREAGIDPQDVGFGWAI